MRSHDVLVLPSLFEGFGLVILEAMSQGLPVITTPHTAGPDIISDGEDGFIISIRSSDAIVEKIELLDKNRELLFEMSRLAEKKSEKFSWDNYSQKIIETISSFIAT
jgi:glycosyltransferase involved in cell wall biosynthesis